MFDKNKLDNSRRNTLSYKIGAVIGTVMAGCIAVCIAAIFIALTFRFVSWIL